MAIFPPNALKSPKIAQNLQWYFQNPLTLPFSKSSDFYFYFRPFILVHWHAYLSIFLINKKSNITKKFENHCPKNRDAPEITKKTLSIPFSGKHVNPNINTTIIVSVKPITPKLEQTIDQSKNKI